MKRTRLWTGLAAAVTVATGVTVWAFQPTPDGPSESKSASVTRNGKSADALLQSALQRQFRQDSSGATQDYRRVLEMDPKNKRAWYGLGLIDQQYGRTADARADFEKALAIDPHFMSALYSEAYMLKSSDPDQAIQLLERASAAEPKAAAIQLQLGRLLMEKGRKGEAEAAFRRAVTIDHRLLSQVPEQFRDSVRPGSTTGGTRTSG
ncbi:tetratricopeptide repeat protein [Streptomyces tropicalis]|uniref:Tetratricopeptide repeat protein n=1 Tax=Streptomyces tropicalis TaxID=3034234 RepID=A0ABT6A0J2_9ACTN|nr:tetratricopeptide repeat protein [Streptomyces tropicalis]MDF3298164.1 tetratricopeptide repeat protein [Streptomyces tropicalis]